MKLHSSLDARIRSVRRGFRAGQPLDHRIKLVRERHQAARKKEKGIAKVNLDHR
jgi:hypothetical protein